MRLALLPLIAALMLSGCRAKVEAAEAVVRLPVIEGRPGAAYFELRGGTSQARLVAITSPQIDRIELHDMSMTGGIMRMGKLDSAAFEKDGQLVFAPGGKHAMLFGIDKAVKPGGTVTLNFDIEDDEDVSVEARVESAGGG
jgi:copper(I)-binding protein